MESKRRRIGPAPGEQTHLDYYALLEIPPGADFDTIKQAYHKLALRYHPDRNKGNEVECETKFKDVAAAYAVLSDPEKRSQYDSSHRFFQSNDLREVFNQFVSSGSTGSFSDFWLLLLSFFLFAFLLLIFLQYQFALVIFRLFPTRPTTLRHLLILLHGAGSFSFNKKRPPSKGQNLRTTLHVTFNESVFGCTKTIALKTLVWCTACGGLGVGGHCTAKANGSSNASVNGRLAAECAACGGTGTYSQRSSVVTINSTCSACSGKGIVVDETTKCKCCHHGRVHQTKELRIEVPAGVMKNMRKIYEGEGDVGEYGGVAGDLIIVFDVEDSPLFTREGDDATCDVSVTFFQAALGARLSVPGIYGQLLRLDLPAGTQPHDVLRIDEEGFVNVATKKRGHLYVRVVLAIPKILTPLQAELLAQAQHQWNEATAAVSPSPSPSPSEAPAVHATATAPSSSYGYEDVAPGGVNGFDSTQHQDAGDRIRETFVETKATTATTIPVPPAPTRMSMSHITNLHNISITTSGFTGGYECS